MAEIKTVTIDELRQMNDQEGLILQGCGGDLQEWVDGINELFAQAGILQAGSAWKAKAVRSFQYDGLTNLLFPLRVFLWIWEGWPYGGSRHMNSSAGPGSATMCPTGWAVLSRSSGPQSPKWRWWDRTEISSASWAGPPGC